MWTVDVSQNWRSHSRDMATKALSLRTQPEMLHSRNLCFQLSLPQGLVGVRRLSQMGKKEKTGNQSMPTIPALLDHFRRRAVSLLLLLIDQDPAARNRSVLRVASLSTDNAYERCLSN